MVDYIAEHDDAMLDKYLTEHVLDARGDAHVDSPVYPGAENRSGACGFRVQEQRHSAAAGRGRGLSAVAAGCAAGGRRGSGDRGGAAAPRQRTISRFAALAFKIMSDPFVGHVTYIRVYSGVLKSGSYCFEFRQEFARANRPFVADAREQARRDRCDLCGRHCACVGLKSVNTGDTLCDEDKPIILESIVFPAPVISVAIEPKTKADQEKLGVALRQAGAGRSDLPRVHRAGHRPDADFRHGRVAPRDHCGPHDA